MPAGEAPDDFTKQLEAQGALPQQETVVRDGLLVTGSHPEDAARVAQVVLDYISPPDTRDEDFRNYCSLVGWSEEESAAEYAEAEKAAAGDEDEKRDAEKKAGGDKGDARKDSPEKEAAAEDEAKPEEVPETEKPTEE